MAGISIVIAGIAALAVVVGVPMLRTAARVPAPLEPVVTALLDALPGGNCGACGNASCFVAARAVASGRAPHSVCAAGGAATAAKVARVLRQHGRA